MRPTAPQALLPLAHLTLALLWLSTTLVAQTGFRVYPTDSGASATYVSRPAGNVAGETLVELHADFFRGLGDQGNDTCRVNGSLWWAADEDRLTSDTYDVVLRRTDPTTGVGPDITAAGEIARITGLSTPTNQSGGRGSWVMRDAYATPVTVPCDDGLFYGVGLAAAPNWPSSDGLAFWSAFVNTGTRNVGENPRAGYPQDVVWAYDIGNANTFTVDRTVIVEALVDTPILQIGGIDPNSCLNGPNACGTPNYGLGGLFPDVSGSSPRHDGIGLRIRDNNRQNSIFGALIGAGFIPGGLPLNFLDGRWRIDFGSLSPAASGTMNGSDAEFVFIPPGVIPASAVGADAYFQAVVLDPATGRLAATNAQRTSL